MVIGRGLLGSVLVAAVFVSAPVHAQAAEAILAGTVTNAPGAVVSNANVSIKNTATGVERDIKTDSAGFYSPPNVRPGVYDITAAVPGFSIYR
jgi:hypothetical protein